MPICLCVICGRFCAALTDSRSCCRDDVARNDRDIYSMALYRKKNGYPLFQGHFGTFRQGSSPGWLCSLVFVILDWPNRHGLPRNVLLFDT